MAAAIAEGTTALRPLNAMLQVDLKSHGKPGTPCVCLPVLGGMLDCNNVENRLHCIRAHRQKVIRQRPERSWSEMAWSFPHRPGRSKPMTGAGNAEEPQIGARPARCPGAQDQRELHTV